MHLAKRPAQSPPMHRHKNRTLSTSVDESAGWCVCCVLTTANTAIAEQTKPIHWQCGLYFDILLSNRPKCGSFSVITPGLNREPTPHTHPHCTPTVKWLIFLDVLTSWKWHIFQTFKMLKRTFFAFLLLLHLCPPSFLAFALYWSWLLHPQDQRQQIMKPG